MTAVHRRNEGGRLAAPALLLLLGVLAAGASAAGNDRDLRHALGDCAGIAEDAARLDCFDRLTAEMIDADAPPDRAQAQAGSESVADFGAESLRRERDGGQSEALDAITADITHLEERPFGERVFHLSNGQVWTELEAGRSRYRTGQQITIERTPFGGYMLATESGRATRVRRVK